MIDYDNLPEYSSERIDRLMEQWRKDPTPDNRSALWRAILEGNEWHRRMGWRHGQEHLIEGMGQYVKEKR